MSNGKRRPAHGDAEPSQAVKVVDLYCGVGGLSHGLQLEGFDVVAGVDNDKTCRHAYETNNEGRFIGRDIARFTVRELTDLYQGARVRVLVGCAPCQPYSSLSRRRLSKKDAKKRWYPLYRFMTLIRRTKPEIVSMENVPDLADARKYRVFDEFLGTLKDLGYQISFKIVDASRYGVPQRRTRLVLLASLLGPISLVAESLPAGEWVSVRDAIGALPALEDGAEDPSDPLHRTSRLSDLNKQRIAATPKDGGSATSWPAELIPACYQRTSGKSYMATVYGRMRWADPAPTMTTQCTTLGTGRFGHPTQDRAISLREAALLQSFPPSYDFGDQIKLTHAARHIGNAVPVLLARAIGRSLKQHLEEHGVIAQA